MEPTGELKESREHTKSIHQSFNRNLVVYMQHYCLASTPLWLFKNCPACLMKMTTPHATGHERTCVVRKTRI